MHAAGLRLLCPACRGTGKLLGEVPRGGWACPQCGFLLGCRDGIYRALAPERDRRYAQFSEEYLAVRRAEGRGSERPEYYCALPYEDLTGRQAWQWKMRAKTYRYFERRLLSRWERDRPQGLDVLDAGAGSGWLSYRLALRGHRPAAVDLLTDELDGLGAARHYFSKLAAPFPRFQAEFDRLPFAEEQFDVVVFNASFHYSADYGETLSEARRCLRRGGRLVVLDSPVYPRPDDGERMREERHQQFERQYGFRSDSIPSIEFLDLPAMKRLEAETGIRWRISKPWYGWSWHVRPLKARLAGKRTPSRFWIWEGSWTER